MQPAANSRAAVKNLLLLAVVLAAVSVSAQQRASVPMATKTIVPVTTNGTGNPEADHEHDAIWAAWRATPPDGLKRTDRAYWEWQDKVFKKFAEDAQSFAQKYPQDPRRWDTIVQSGYSPPWFVTGFKPEFDAEPGVANLIVDEAAVAAFKARQSKLYRDVILADDATPRQRLGSFAGMLAENRIATGAAGVQPDLSKFEPLMEEVAVKLPDERGAALLVMYLDALRTSAPDQAADFEAKLADKPVGKVVKELAAKQEQERAEARLETLRRTVDIGTINFTAADGRAVDLNKMRGKVVLVDFWATWCGPCIKEIPNIVTNYQKYHDKGFEVVGIAVEKADLAVGDNNDAKGEKLATVKQKMLAFTKKNNMPWPQYFDGLYFDGEYMVKYGIKQIPAMFLLDNDGKVASIEARGPDLEKELKRLLGL